MSKPNGFDRNALARAAFSAGQKFAPRNGSGLEVPERLAGGTPQQAKVAVATISGHEITQYGAMALGALQYMSGRMGMPFFLMAMRSDVPANARNIAIDSARANGCDWVLLLDGTLSYPPDALLRLVQLAYAHNLDVVGATIASPAYPHRNLAIPKGGAQQVATVGTLVEVDALPPSFLLVRLAALEALKRPYFRYTTIEEGEPWPAILGEPPGPDAKAEPTVLNDGMTFCAALRAAGIKIWLEVTLSAQVSAWGECGYQLTGSDDPENQVQRVEFGMPPPAQPQAEAVAGSPDEPAANEAKLEVSH